MLEDYLSEKQKKKRKQKRIIWIGSIILVLFLSILGTVWFFGESPVSRTDRVVVVGNHTVSTDAIVSLVEASTVRRHTFLGALFGSRNMFAWPSALEKDDVALVPQLASVTLKKSYTSHTLTVTVVEREPLAIWCSMPTIGPDGNPTNDESCFWFDKDGVMFEKAFDTKGSALYAVHDYSQSNLGLGKNILPDLFLGNMLSILVTMKNSNLTTKEIALRDISLEEIEVSVYNGPSLYFSLRFPADNDLVVLKKIMILPNFSSLQYIDFRTENRTYYK